MICKLKCKKFQLYFMMIKGLSLKIPFWPTLSEDFVTEMSNGKAKL